MKSFLICLQNKTMSVSQLWEKKRKFVATTVVIKLMDEDEREAKQEHG